MRPAQGLPPSALETMRLATFISDNAEEILQEFEDFARSLAPPEGDMDVAALRDHAARILETFVQDLRRSDGGDLETGRSGARFGAGLNRAAGMHGSQRASESFSVAAAFAEFRALRASVLRLWIAEAGLPDAEEAVDDLLRFNELIDQAVAESIGRFWIDHQRVMEERADEARRRRMAEEADSIKSQFLRLISHELRTPLNAISGHIALLEMGFYGQVTDEQRTALGRVKHAEQHLLGIVESILNYQRLGASKVEYKMQELPLAQVTEGLSSILEPMAESSDVTVSCDVDSPDTRVWVDRDKLRQVLLNLMSNAVRFTPPGGRVWLDYVETSEGPCLRVHDTGPGIPKDKLEAVFDPFVQLDTSLTRERGGVGLGLAISRGFMRGMGGELTLESEMGGGSVFSIHLPCRGEGPR